MTREKYMPEPVLLSIVQVAALLGVSERTAHTLAADPGFPSARMLGPRAARWLRVEVEAYCAALPPAQVDEATREHASRMAQASAASRRATRARRPPPAPRQASVST